jgi:hypothetical protein
VFRSLGGLSLQCSRAQASREANHGPGVAPAAGYCAGTPGSSASVGDTFLIKSKKACGLV